MAAFWSRDTFKDSEEAADYGECVSTAGGRVVSIVFGPTRPSSADQAYRWHVFASFEEASHFDEAAKRWAERSSELHTNDPDSSCSELGHWSGGSISVHTDIPCVKNAAWLARGRKLRHGKTVFVEPEETVPLDKVLKDRGLTRERLIVDVAQTSEHVLETKEPKAAADDSEVFDERNGLIHPAHAVGRNEAARETLVTAGETALSTPNECSVCGKPAGQKVGFASGAEWICSEACEKWLVTPPPPDRSKAAHALNAIEQVRRDGIDVRFLGMEFDVVLTREPHQSVSISGERRTSLNSRGPRDCTRLQAPQCECVLCDEHDGPCLTVYNGVPVGNAWGPKYKKSMLDNFSASCRMEVSSLPDEASPTPNAAPPIEDDNRELAWIAFRRLLIGDPPYPCKPGNSFSTVSTKVAFEAGWTSRASISDR